MAPSSEPCSRCKSSEYPTVLFSATSEGRAGDAEPLCAVCMSGELRVDIAMELLAPGPAPRKKALRKAKKTSLHQERDIAKAFGARMQPGSGNQPGHKGDHRKKGELRIEAKYTEARSYRLELDTLDKIAGEAAHGELPVLVIDFIEPGTRRLRDRFTVIHSNDFQELHAARANRGSERST